jgi:uroporphyrinogen-III decarboxylase
MGNNYRGRSYGMTGPLYAEWLEKTGMDMMYVYIPWHTGRKEVVDKWGLVRWENGYFTVDDLRKDPPYETIRRRLDEVCSVKKDWGIEVAVYSAPMLLCDGLGLEKFMLMSYDNPDLLESYLETINEKVALELEIICEYPVDAIQMSNILAEKNGPICNDEQMERFHLRYLRWHVQHIRARGKIATLHCDGKLDKLYQRIADAGFQCINGYDSDKFAADLKQWGKKIAMRGSIPMNDLYTMSIGDMRLAVQKAKALPSHVIGSTHDFPEGKPLLFMAMVEEFTR